jgi:hypothetical protein
LLVVAAAAATVEKLPVKLSMEEAVSVNSAFLRHLIQALCLTLKSQMTAVEHRIVPSEKNEFATSEGSLYLPRPHK